MMPKKSTIPVVAKVMGNNDKSEDWLQYEGEPDRMVDMFNDNEEDNDVD